jgi:acyl-coenzyme A synthetase/AMP-(fatty) acid ligase
VCENRVLRRIFESKREEVAGAWRILHNEELHTLYTSPNTTRMMKSRRMSWTVYDVAHMGEMRNT